MNLRRVSSLLWLGPLLFILGLGLGYYLGHTRNVVTIAVQDDAASRREIPAQEAPAAQSSAAVQSIAATHFTGNSFAPDMWGSLDMSKAPAQLEAIRSNGFNTVIIPVPWCGFQTGVDPVVWGETYFARLEELFNIAAAKSLKVLLRVGYLHEVSNPGSPDGGYRALHILTNPALERAWIDYLRRIREIMQRHDNALFAFLSWEDFFIYHVTWIPDEQRRLDLAREIGFQDFLRGTPLEKINSLYKQNFTGYESIYLPLFDTPECALVYAFQDRFWLQVLSLSRSVFPEMQFEVRNDCDPTGGGPLYCHDVTFDLGGGGGVTVLYYSPAWGAPNSGDLASAGKAAHLLEAMLSRVREKTDNPFFIDQFNFVDNTLEFMQNTRIDPDEIPDFLALVAPILKKHTMGYSLWTMQDKPRSVLPNGSFELGELHWTIQDGWVLETPGGGRSLILEKGGQAAQVLHLTGGLRGVGDYRASEFDLTLRLHVANMNSEQPARFFVRFYDEEGKQVYEAITDLAAREEKTMDLTGIPGIVHGKLEFSCLDASVRFDQALLYAFVQQNGIYDLDGNPRPFRDAVVQLNAALLGLPEPPPHPLPEH